MGARTAIEAQRAGGAITADTNNRVLHELLETAADLRDHGLVSNVDFDQLKALESAPPGANTETPATKK